MKCLKDGEISYCSFFEPEESLGKEFVVLFLIEMVRLQTLWGLGCAVALPFQGFSLCGFWGVLIACVLSHFLKLEFVFRYFPVSNLQFPFLDFTFTTVV